MTVQDENKNNVHLDLDSGATVSFAKLSAVLSHGFKILPNQQLSNLADGKTKLPAVGEIHETFYRNNWSVSFNAIVTKDLHCDFVAGNNFFKENAVTQNIEKHNILVHSKYIIPETSKNLILPTVPNNLILQNNHVEVLYPGETLKHPVPHPDHSILAVQPFHQNKIDNWPPPQLCSVTNGVINISNNTADPINIKKEAPRLQIRTTSQQQQQQTPAKSYPLPSTKPPCLEDISINTKDISTEAINIINNANITYKEVFNNDLSQGYNMAFGKHICKLNWASDNRPPSSKVHVVNYDHETKCLLQNVCDQFTAQGVLGLPLFGTKAYLLLEAWG